MLLGLYPEDVKQGEYQDIFMDHLLKKCRNSEPNEGVSVYDSFLKQSYVSKRFLGTVRADTTARNTVGKFCGVSGYRADYQSLFEGAKFSNINSEGTYFSPVKQRMFFKERCLPTIGV